MSVEVGNQFKNVGSLGPNWVVQRILSGPGMMPHAILTQSGDTGAIRTISISALEDKAMFERAPDALPAAMPSTKSGTLRGLFRLARKAA
jgi:hypothetical protein